MSKKCNIAGFKAIYPDHKCIYFYQVISKPKCQILKNVKIYKKLSKKGNGKNRTLLKEFLHEQNASCTKFVNNNIISPIKI